MRRLLSSFFNTLLAPFGVALKSTKSVRLLEERNGALLSQVHALHLEVLFPDLPENDKREKLLGQLIGTTLSEGLYIVDGLHKSLSLQGDICEFGIAQGATSALLANEIKSTGKALWLYDSFEGLPAPSQHDELIDDIFDLGSMENYQGSMKCGEELVTARLRALEFPGERIQIVKGWVEESIKAGKVPDEVCFAYVDFDFHDPILAALEFLDQRLVDGGHVVVDDYGFFSSGAQKAVDGFMEKVNERWTFALPHKSAGHFCLLKKLRSS